MSTVSRRVLTLEEFTIKELRAFPRATGELAALLRDIGLAAKRVNVDVNKAGLVDILGDAGTTNVQGEVVKKLDLFANEQFSGVLQHGVSCAGITSEEMDDFQAFDDDISVQSKYVCSFDPLDGSTNIDVNVSIGTIFGIYRRKTPKGTPVTKEDFLQAGVNLVAAGYVIFGSSTMLVYGTRRGVNGFTLDPAIGEFTLSHPDIKCPENGQIYSINQAQFYSYNQGIQDYLTACMKKDKENGGPYTQRYIGSMVADIHRNLLKGGIFMYPPTKERPGGKIRLMYESNPFAFIVEVAGGRAISAKGKRILDIMPEDLHERSPLYIGSKAMVDELETYL
ncbi:MAG: class 1 fructose-bisphosphatase [Niabella sp.]